MYIIIIYYRLHSNLSTTESLRLVEEDLALGDSVGLGAADWVGLHDGEF